MSTKMLVAMGTAPAGFDRRRRLKSKIVTAPKIPSPAWLLTGLCACNRLDRSNRFCRARGAGLTVGPARVAEPGLSAAGAGEDATQAVASGRGCPAEGGRRARRPFGLPDRSRLGREVVGEDELVDACALGDAPDLRHVGVESRHPFQLGARRPVALEVAEIRDTVEEDVRFLGEGDEIVVDRGV